MSGLTSAQTTGGYDPTQLGIMRQNLSNLALTGGYDPAALATYKDFTTTGGYSPGDISRYLRVATGGLTNTYKTLADQAQRQRAATGGLGPDATAMMARNLAAQQGTTTDQALADIHQMVDLNKIRGAQGLGDIAAGKRAGTQQQVELESGVSRGVTAANQTLAQLYNVDSGQITNLGRMILDSYGIDSRNQAVALQALVNLSSQPDLFNNILAALQTGAYAYNAYRGQNPGSSPTGQQTDVPNLPIDRSVGYPPDYIGTPPFIPPGPDFGGPLPPWDTSVPGPPGQAGLGPFGTPTTFPQGSQIPGEELAYANTYGLGMPNIQGVSGVYPWMGGGGGWSGAGYWPGQSPMFMT